MLNLSFEALIGLDREEEGRHPVDVGLELVPVLGRVALGDEDEIDLVVGVARDLGFVDPVARGGLFADDVVVGRVDDLAEERLEEVALVALFDDEEDRTLGQGDADGALEDARRPGQRRGGRLVLGEHRVEAALEDEPVRGDVVEL